MGHLVRPRSRSRASVPVAILLATFLITPGPAGADSRASAPAASGPEASVLDGGTDLVRALAIDGTFLGAAGIAGTVDASAWSLVSDLAAGEPPRFAPAVVAAASPIGPWSALGSDGTGDGALNDLVDAIVVSGDDLYVGGRFTNAAGIATADYIARWDGTAWSALGTDGAGGPALTSYGYGVFSLAVSGADLYVGGSFVVLGPDGYAGPGTAIPGAAYLARWNGSAWSSVGTYSTPVGAIGAVVHALAVAGDDLYVGGGFYDAAGIAIADRLAKWDGTTWSAVGSDGAGNAAFDENNDVIDALAVDGTNLYVSGIFTDAAGIAAADNVARWDGSDWSALGSNGAGNGAMNGAVLAVAVSGADLYAGGVFTDAAGIVAADYVARWNGSAWSALGPAAPGWSGALNSSVFALAIAGSNLYVGGGFTNAAGIAAADHVAKWNGSAWSALGSNGAGNGALSSLSQALAVSGASLIVGGNYLDAAGLPTADNIAAWSLVPFTDIIGTTFEKDIIWVWQQGITSGCSSTKYCPGAPVTRGQMASFLARALALPDTTMDYFTDDDGTTHEDDINRVAKAGITSGCASGKYCPSDNVTRGQMASFLVRALGLTAGATTDYFTDDNGTTHEPNINRLRHAELTTGCTPTTYCPAADVTRGQMAAFLHRAFGP